jgi:eukaryotic-like serine/threonine-protein kinase
VVRRLGNVVRRATGAGSGPPSWIADRYELGGVVGRGGMGEVRAATDERLQREVAVKLLRPDLAAIEEARRRFEGEAQAAAALVHPNVVTVFDAGEEDGAPFIVMELLPGRTLVDELATGPMSSVQVRDLAGAVLGALEAAHNAGILHRDVKPGNVLRAGDGTWKVADFGIAKVAETTGDLTVSGVVIGTPAYIAPERIDGAPATPASDLYSAGAVLYEALAGRKPFAGDNFAAVAEQIRAGRAPALHELVPEVDPGLERVVERAMATDPRHRFASAVEMRRALDESPAPTVPPAARPDDVTEPQWGPPVTQTQGLPTAARPRRRAPVARRLWLAGVGAVLLVLIVVGIVLSQRESGTSSSPPASSSPAPTTAGATQSRDLDRALDELREAVQR